MSIVPHVRAQTYLQAMHESTTRPALFSCRTENGSCEDYVVKFHNRLGSYIICELMAALLGHQLGLPIPPVAIVEVDPRIALTISDPDMKESVSQSVSPHFGSLYRSGGYQTLLPGMSIPKRTIPHAFNIFAFDMFIQNPDRTDVLTQGKPNLLFDGERFLIFDHEKAFSFVADIGASPKPWMLRDLPFARNHILYPRLFHYKDKESLPFGQFVAKTAGLSDAFLDSATSCVPENWRNPEKLCKIVAHITSLRDNPTLFEQGLREVLA